MNRNARDFRIARRNTALATAERLENEAACGGNALETPEGLLLQAAKFRDFAAWIGRKIVDFPATAA